MNGLLSTHVNFILVFFEGILSFFSPCVIPLLPVYMSYLAGNAKNYNEDGEVIYNRKKMLFHTMFFILGISTAFFTLGLTFTSLGDYFNENKLLFTKLSGILIMLLGFFQLGVFNFSFLQRERKFHINLENRQINPLVAFLLGFTFSFAWMPCIGPMLSSVLLMASSAKTYLLGYGLVLIYTAGFVIPFLVLGAFTTKALDLIKRNKKFLSYTIKLGAIILILIGFMTYTGFMNGISGYLNSLPGSPRTTQNETDKDSPTISSAPSPEAESTSTHPSINFTLTDQYGNEHTLSDYKGKIVFLNFWATWCPPCNKEMPDIEELYKEYDSNKGDVIFLGVTNPVSAKYPNNQDVDQKAIKAFLTEKGYTFPTVFDESGDLLASYQINAFPTTFIINRDGNILGYVPGMMTKDIMKNVIKEALQDK